MVDDQDTPQDEPTPDEPTPEEPTAEEPTSEEPTAEEPTSEEPTAGEPTADEPTTKEQGPEDTTPEEPAAEQPEAGELEAPAERPKPKAKKKDAKAAEPEAIPGAHLEPDLVLEEEKPRDDETGYAGAELIDDAATDADADPDADGDAAGASDDDEEEASAPLNAVLDLAADARYRATGKRKSAVARVTLKPGTGEYTINGKSLNEYFPRATLQTQARRPLETVGQQERMDVVAKIHGGGVSAQAGALRHGITKALVEADPNLRGELKRRGFLTRDPRVKERKKAGLKKARKRPQFSKR